MKKTITVFLFLIAGFQLKCQTTTGSGEGTVSYISSQNIYVTFNSTKDISPGDTLFMMSDGKLLPVLKVNNLSSISCVCVPISQQELKVSDKIYARQKEVEVLPEATKIKENEPVTPVPEVKDDTLSDLANIQKVRKQETNGRVSVSSYSNFSDTPAGNSQRMRYNLSFNAKNINDSKLSAESYISFVHSDVNWDDVQNNIFNGLKIYNLALRYELNDNTNLWFGRKINNKISSVGAIDGLQFEKKFKPLTIGIFTGTRPDYSDYGFNFNLFQFGAYLAREYTTRTGSMLNSAAFIEQKNDFKTDRRFAYFQHTNSLVKNLYFFGSAELELYKVEMVDSIPVSKNTLDLSNLYLSLRYKVMRQLSLSISYNTRQNIIYYESYKSFFERMLDYQTQGWRLQAIIRPVKLLTIGITSGYRYEKDDPDPSKNLYAYLTYNRIPGLNIATTLSVTLLETSYNNGNIYSLGISRDLVPGKLSGAVNYRMVDYQFTNSEVSLAQKIIDSSITWKISKKMSFSAHYEGTFEKERTYNRVYLNINRYF